MKFLEISDFETISRGLSFEAQDCRVSGRCELFTTKAAGVDKKLYKQLERHLEARMQETLALARSLSPDDMSKNIAKSPFGPLDLISSRRTFVYLVATLNASHPDHDFSTLQPSDFRKERNLRLVMNSFNTTLFNLARGKQLQAMWDLIDHHVELLNCDIYSYYPDGDSDPHGGDGLIWSATYFFFNKHLKRVLYLSLRGLSKNARQEDDESVEDTGYSDQDVVGVMEV